MKAVIVSHKRGGSYVLDHQGSFRFVRGHTSQPVGSEISVPAPGTPSRLATMVTSYCLMLALLLGGFAWLWNSQSYTVYLDINPSVELQFNCFDRLIGAHALNEDAEALLENLKLSGTPAEVVTKLLDSASEEGLLSGVSGFPSVLVTIIAQNDDASLSHMYVMMRFMQSGGFEHMARITTCDAETRERALSLGVSPGKLTLVEELLGADPTVPIEDAMNMPVGDLFNTIKEAEEQNIDGTTDSVEQNEPPVVPLEDSPDGTD